jgi:UV DNA damage endonuclease
MEVRIGYVSIALKLPGVTTSSTVSYTNYCKLSTLEKKHDKLKLVTLSNLNALNVILKYNMENDIHFYRITSALIPLATHPETLWNYRLIFKKDFEEIGRILNTSGIRADTHPDQFNVINSIKSEVVSSTINNLWFHVHLFEDMEYKYGKMVLHVGSSAGGKKEALERFKFNFHKIPLEISEKIILENDDKTFTVNEVLKLCRDLAIPMVLDVHHHKCNNDGEKIEERIEEIFNTWKGQHYPPKIHFSSPKNGEMDRSHSDYINAWDFINFLDNVKFLNKNFDVMVEAKMKDLALYKLVEDIKELKPEWKWKDNSTLIL